MDMDFSSLRTMRDLRRLLKWYGIMIYTKDQLGDLALMEDEVRELYELGMLDVQTYQKACLLLKQEKTKLERMSKR